MRLRLLVASLLAPLALAGALPAAARAPAGTASVDFTHNGGCSVTVTYTWSGFNGRTLYAYLGVVRSLGFGVEAWIFVSTAAEGSGTASHTFDLTGRGSFTWSGGGRLLDGKGRTLAGSDVRSASSAALACAPAV